MKVVFTNATDGTNPIFRNIFKCCSGGDASIGIAFCWIVNVSAGFTDILLHNVIFVFIINSFAKIVFLLRKTNFPREKCCFYGPNIDFPAF